MPETLFALRRAPAVWGLLPPGDRPTEGTLPTVELPLELREDFCSCGRACILGALSTRRTLLLGDGAADCGLDKPFLLFTPLLCLGCMRPRMGDAADAVPGRFTDALRTALMN